MLDRRQTAIVLVTVGVLMVVGMLLLWVVIVMGDFTDPRIEAANPLSNFRIVIAFVVWLCFGTVVVLGAVWAATRPPARGKDAAPVTKPLRQDTSVPAPERAPERIGSQ
jgi:hypothetical protein